MRRADLSPSSEETAVKWFLLTVELAKNVLKLAVYRSEGLNFEDFACIENHE